VDASDRRVESGNSRKPESDGGGTEFDRRGAESRRY